MRTKFSGILTLFMAFVVQLTFAQEKTITGTVSDANSGMPLAGVNIVIEGTTIGTQTDFDGNYNISASTGQTLVFTYIGYADKKAKVGSNTNIDITLTASAAELDQVVVTALGIKRKKDEITSASKVIKAEELTQAADPNVVNSLTGKVTGLTIKSNSGLGQSPRIVLRSGKSMTGDNQALIVIDGAISTASYFQTLDPNSIASVNTIKGPSGAALYGSQGSNGVLIVTTKKGTTDEKMKVSVNTSVQFESVAYVPEQQTRYGQGWSNGVGYSHVLHENGTWGPEFDGQMVPIGLPQEDGSYIMAPYSSRGSDNMKDFFDTGATYLNSVRISSGGDDGYASLSAQNQNTEFVVKGDKLKKSTYTFNAGKTLGKWKVSGNATYSYSSIDQSYQADANNDIMRQLLQTPTNIPIEQFENSGNEGHWTGYYLNPYWVRDNIRREQEYERFNILGQVEYKFNDHISALVRSNGLFTFANTLRYTNAYTDPQYVVDIVGAPRDISSSFRYYDTTFARYYTDFITNFDYDLTDDISFKANVGVNSQYEKNTLVSVGGTGLTIPGVYTLSNLAGPPETSVTGDSRSSTSRLAAFGSFDFGYKDFLFLHLTGRNDWTSVLAKSNNSFFYPSVGLSFVPTKAFPSIKGDILNYWKINASYVKVGNDGGIDAYDTQSTYVQAPGFPYGNVNSYVFPSTITDPLLEPAFTTSYEIGMNLGFFNDRVTLDAAYYKFTTDNQIVSIAASSASGIGRSQVNLGKTKGSGLELTLGLTPIKTDDFKWDLRIGYSNPENEVVKVSDQTNEVSLGGFTGFAEVFAVEGQPYPVIKANGYVHDGDGRVVIDPLSGAPIEDPNLKIQGQVTPDYIVNFNTSFKYKGFTLSATMDYRTGHVFYAATAQGMTFSGYLVESQQPGRGPFIFPNSSYEFPAGSGEYVANTNIPSGGTTPGTYINFWTDYSNVGSNYVLDATALKLRELSLSYSLNEKWLKDTFFTGITISAIGRNLVTVLPEENRGYSDPESSFTNGNAQGITTTGQYPPTKTYGMAVNLTF